MGVKDGLINALDGAALVENVNVIELDASAVSKVIV